MSDETTYIMADNDDITEDRRLSMFEAGRDPGTTRRLSELGVSEGWRCLEVGAGRGSIARWLAERVGPTGSVLAVDIDPRFLTDLPANVEVGRVDIEQDEVEPNVFDLVHCRTVLMHLRNPALAASHMVSALRPGGALLAEEGDFGLHRHRGHPRAEEMNDLNHQLFSQLTQSGRINAWFGRTLTGVLAAAGLEVIGEEIELDISGPGEPGFEFQRASFVAATPRTIAAGLMTESHVELADAVFTHEHSVVSGGLFATWGRCPG